MEATIKMSDNEAYIIGLCSQYPQEIKDAYKAWDAAESKAPPVGGGRKGLQSMGNPPVPGVCCSM